MQIIDFQILWMVEVVCMDQIYNTDMHKSVFDSI